MAIIEYAHGIDEMELGVSTESPETDHDDVEKPSGSSMPGRAYHGRAPPTIEVEIEGHGYLRYYSRDGRFQATCNNCDHDTCRRTRFWKEGNSGSSGGRVLGYLAAFLLCSYDYSTTTDHVKFPYSKAIRLAARHHLRMMVPRFADLEAKERDLEDGEDSEPDEI